MKKTERKTTKKRTFLSVATGVLGAAVVATTLVAAVACNKETAKSNKIKFTFDTQGGTAMQQVEIKIGETYTLPTPPAREGFEFGGWYTSATFEGSPVTEVKADSNQTYYAKWTQLAKITLELDGGSLSSTVLYLKAGANLYEFMQAYRPEKSGLTFGAWFNGANELSATAKMPSNGVTLTAKYKVNYTVQFYIQNLDGNGYTLSEKDTVTDSAYYETGKTFVSTRTLAGCEENVTHADRVVEKQLSVTASENVFKHYFDRLTFNVRFAPNYPNGAQADDESFTKKFGEYIQVPNDYEAEGYCLIGWAESPNATVPKYQAYYVDQALQNGTGEKREAESFTPTEHTRLYGVWAKGYTDIFDGDDYLFFLDKTKDGELDKSVIYVSRGNQFFKGEYDEEYNIFEFFDEKERVVLQGHLYENEKFVYVSTKRIEKEVFLYMVGEGLDTNVKLKFDTINGIYFHDGDDVTYGTQQSGEEGEYIADFTNATEGKYAGKKVYFILGTYSGKPAFIALKEEERDLGTLKRFYYNATTKELVTYVNGYGDLTLNGYGTATYNGGSSASQYYYKYEDGVITLTSQYGGLFGKASIMEVKGEKGYVLYTQWQDREFNIANESGAKLVLDGGIEATYTNGTETVNCYYSVTESIFGGYLVKLDEKNGTKKFTFLVTETKFNSDGDKLETCKTTAVNNTYAEYRYLADGKVYNAAAIVLDQETEGRLTLYGFDSRLNEFVKVSEGVYTKNSDKENDPYYSYTADKFVEGVSGILEDPVDPSKVQSFVFALDSETTSYNLFYWESSVNKADPEKPNEEPESTQYVIEYECATEDDAELRLVGGFAYYTTKDGVSVSGAYGKPEDGKTYIVIMTSGAAGNRNYYVDLDEDNLQFTPLEYAPYISYFFDETGEMQDGEDDVDDDGVYLSFDGKGGAIFVDADGKEVQGTVRETNEKTGNATISEFVSNEETFRYVSGLSVGSTSVFLRYNETYNGEYNYYEDTVRKGNLKLDGYGYTGKYLVDGKTYEGTYLIVEENVVELTDSTAKKKLYFDITDSTAKTITVRAEEYGEYLWVKNRDWQEKTYFELDGYGGLSVYTKTETKDETTGETTETKNYIDENGTYEKDGEKFVLRYEKEGAPIALYGELGTFSKSLAFLEQLESDDPVIGVYVNASDWSVLILDDVGNAIKYAGEEDADLEVGQKQVGYYTLITENLLYFVNDRNTDACLYEYSIVENEDGTITRSATPVKFKDTRYLTEKMETLMFSKYGYITVTNEEGELERHFYKENYEKKTLVSLTIYISDPDNTDTKYGFVEETIQGGYAESLDFKDKNYFQGKKYFKNYDENIVFNRAEGEDTYTIPSLGKIEKLKFEASNELEFEKEGTVEINGQINDCTVVREKNEAGEYLCYITVGNYRFHVKFDYKGVEKDEVTDSSYTVTAVEFHQTSHARNYLDTYAYYAGFGYKVDNTLGSITIHGSYDAEGNEQDIVVDAEFLKDSSVKDANGNLITFENATFVDHGTDASLGGKHYEAQFDVEDEEGNKTAYSLHFIVAKHSQVNAYGFNVLALTYRQVFGETTDEYQIATERVTYSEYANYKEGDLYDIDLMQEGNTLDGEPVMGRNSVIQYVDGNVLYAVRTKAEGSDQYNASIHYTIALDTDPIITNTDGTVEVPLYKGAEVKATQAVDEIFYALGGKYFVEFIGGNPILLCMAQETFVVKALETVQLKDGNIDVAFYQQKAVEAAQAENPALSENEIKEIQDEIAEWWAEYLPKNDEADATVQKAYIATTATNGARYMVEIRALTVENETVSYVYVQQIFE